MEWAVRMPARSMFAWLVPPNGVVLITWWQPQRLRRASARDQRACAPRPRASGSVADTHR
jgi:hypothetical protein